MTRSTVRKRFLWLLKKTSNRLTAWMARAGHGPFSLIRHVGRKSGRTYETPVILAEVPEGFVAELTYGDDVDWYRNSVAAGVCIVTTAASTTALPVSRRAALSGAEARIPAHSDRC
jgi:deazaflavin-dependent oxidoreductase (nitroreductase family)